MVEFELPPRLVDWTILSGVACAVASGVLGFLTGRPGDWWVFALHGAIGIALVVPIAWKLRRVRPRVTAAAWSRATVVSVVLTVLAVGAVLTGTAWASGGNLDLGPWNLLNLHVLLGLLVVPTLLVHLASRFRWPDRADLEGRRTALKYAGIAAVGVGTWSLQRGLNLLTGTAADRRFTGSIERDSFAGNAFPTTAWVADDPDPVDREAYELSVTGAVERPLAADDETLQTFDDRRTATLDCTSGWYSRQEWEGIALSRLLDRAEPTDEARYVTVRSVTGYRCTVPIEDAADLLLATRVGGEPISHGHGAPCRLVAPGRRGFRWVKWVEAIEVRRDPDPGQWAAIFVSWLSVTHD